ncbi:tetratricopeptide repeat protein [Planctomyces sp. SH-PL62]|uniref:tetratricopeptide repeat protein n=1 Tax=Planctomyces sp. SH-PL62 TaxID=1636152 RepID=UPI00078D347E|nr:hypothetical protein [Planctomyces sp. SH-PL62]AMV38258.1 Tetratricopeptide repeat protein [Planctomyces sp. SH-PL62]
MTSSTRNDSETALALVHEGWNHLMSQRPLAAWGAWQRALRLEPGSEAARKALATLESAQELPLAARKTYRFRQPRTPDQRARWDLRMRDGGADELDAAAAVFDRLIQDAPDDVEAWFNRALCLAWRGRDVEAVECLDRVTALEASHAGEGAVEAWTLAEVLRQGGGAEVLADDLRYACNFPRGEAEVDDLLALFPEIRRIPTPRDPSRPDDAVPDVEVLEWLDRPFPAPGQGDGVAAADLPHVLATIYVSPETIRLSSPRVDGLEQAEERLRLMIGDPGEAVERAAAPLPLPFLDAALWTVRLPEGRDRADADRWTREVVENYYEDRWLHQSRQGLDGLSPLAAAHDAHAGDDQARAKLAAVVRLREQLGARPGSAALYQGYPFDRLRRRLGLDLDDPASTESADLSCASPWELKALVPEDLDDHQLIDAFLSAKGLRDDALTAPLAEELLRRRPDGLARVDAEDLASSLVRREMQRDRPEAALDWIERIRPLADPAQVRGFDVWRAEIFARTGRPEEAADAYRRLLDDSAESPRLALDAGETLLDAGFAAVARPFLYEAVRLAPAFGLLGVDRRARRLLETMGRD